jgi:iron complex outermembrane recepter protein
MTRAAAFLATTAISALTLAGSFVLQAVMAPAWAESAERSFDIPAQSLAGAIAAFGRQSGLQVSIAASDARGRRSQPVRGSHAPETALRLMLAGTGLSHRFSGARTVTVFDPAATSPATARAQATTPLDPITIEARRAKQETARGPVEGYVATRSDAGSKTDTPIIETPQSISVVTSDQMTARAVQSVTEALQYTPGVYTHPGGKDPRYDFFSIRGFDAQGRGNYRDGLRELGDANNFAHFRSEPYGLERLDVLRGPSSVLYGQNAPGGLVNLISKLPTSEPIREVVGQIGSANRFQGAFDFGGQADKDGQLLYRLTGVVRDSDAQIAYFSRFVKDDRQFIAPSFTWQPNADTKFTVMTDFQHDLTGNAFPVSMVHLGPGGIANVTALPLFLGDPSWNKFEQNQYRLGYQFEHRVNDAVTVRQNFRYGAVDLDYRYLTGFVLAGSQSFSRVSRRIDEHTNSLTVDNQIQSKVATGPLGHTILLGLDHQRFDLDHLFLGGTGPSLSIVNPIYGQSVTTPTTPLTSTDQKARQLGVYAQDQIKFQNWILTLGGRYDWANLDSLDRVKNVTTSTDDKAFTRRAGLTYLFDSGLAPYASYSESFLPTTGVDAAGNVFKPTTGQQYEVGVKYQIPNVKALLTVAAYDLTQQNVLTPDPVNQDFSVQTGEVRSRGIEAQAVATLTQGLNLVASWTVQNVEVTKSNTAVELGKVPILVPERMASIWMDYTIQNGPLTGFGFGSGVRHVGTTFMDIANQIANEPYAFVDAAIHYKRDALSAALNVSNVFDKRFASCTTSGGCQWQAPRLVTLTVRYRW